MKHSAAEIKKAKNLLNKYAPKGEQLAYINAKESKLLIKKGGAGKMTKTGIRSYQYEHDGADVSESGGPTNDTQSNDDYNEHYAVTPDAPKKSIGAKIKGVLGVVAAVVTHGGSEGIRNINRLRTGVNLLNNLTNTKKSTRKVSTGKYVSHPQYAPYDQTKTGVTPNNYQGNDEPRVAKNVGGRIVKLSPTTAEVSQSKAIDAAAYDNRKTKAKGRSMTILRRNVADSTLILGKKSLLGA
jgi:hypothetical protein